MRAKAIAAVSVVAVAVAIAALVLSGRSISPTTPLTRQQITYTGKAGWPALSPDGGTIAFVEAEPCPDVSLRCTDSLVVQDLARGQTAPLAVGTSIIHPKWNPDGRSVLFQANRVLGAADTAPGAYVVSLLNRTPRRIGPGGAAFNTRGDTIVFGSRVATTSDTIRLRFLRSTDLEVLDSVSLRISGRFVHDLEWSPDGKWLALIVYRGQGDRRVFLVSRRSGTVTDSITVAGRQLVRWVRNSDALLLLLQGGASDDIVLRRGVDRRTGRFTSDSVTKLEIPVGGATFAVSRDGKTLAVVDGSSSTKQFMVMERVGDSVTSRSLLTFTGWSSTPALSPDGRTIALSRSDAQGTNLYLIPFDGGPERPLTSGRDHVDAPVWLRDGRLVFKRGLPSTQLFVVDPRGGRPRPFGPSGYTTGNAWYLQWLDDSSYVLEQWDQHRLFVVDSSGSVRGSLTLPDTLDQLVAVTPDARQLWFLERNAESRRYYSLDRSTKLVTVDRSTRLMRVAAHVPPNSQPVGWADDTYVFATWPNRAASRPKLWHVNSDGASSQITVLPTDCDFGSSLISMSRDGRRFVCVRTSAKRDIWLWRGVDLGR